MLTELLFWLTIAVMLIGMLAAGYALGHIIRTLAQQDEMRRAAEREAAIQDAADACVGWSEERR